MQVTSHADESCCEPGHDHGGQIAHQFRLVALLIGSVLILGSFAAEWIYPENQLVAEWSAAVGALLLALPIFWVALNDLARGHMHMDELVALAVMAAIVMGDFRTAGVVAFFMLISQVIEMRTAQGAHAAIENLVRLSPTHARRLYEEGAEEDVAATALSAGDRIRVLPGETIPTDGTILLGQTTINEATITGESVPADKGKTTDVYAGTVNLTGMIEVEVTRVGEDTTLGRVRGLILAAEQTKLPISKVIDRYAGHYTPVVLMIAALVWFFTDDWTRVVALLVISCPCAFILATPTAMVAALSAAARQGILVKNVVDLESASRIDGMVFDKTGTLTTGELGVVRLAPAEGTLPAELLRIAASAEQHSNHPAAAALQRLAKETDVPLARADDVREEPGKGVEARVEDALVVCGRATWLDEKGAKRDAVPDEDTEGLSAVHVVRGSTYLGWIGMRDQVRAEAAEALAELGELGVKRMIMITGDREAVAQRVSDEVGGLEFRAEYLPQEKAGFVEEVKREGYHVAFVGDGVNDAPALAASDTGIAMGAAGSDVAIHSATVALMSNDLLRIPFLVRLSRAARSAVYQNLAVGAVFIVGGLILSGFGYLSPIVATLMHNVGSLVVVFNSARLVRFGEIPEDDALLEEVNVPSTA
jgi:Cd2+/Zn2+-exporting ATPase